ncbi:hemerythrin domain-containing protein [Hydrogenophaga sp.]|uniref:hemerythrin domain-containing protein n=1 Tax=Hydrogenophaga sp. TaxID=1904254 RepID=UPI003569B4BB
MTHDALRVIRDEHASLAAMLQSLLLMVRQGDTPDGPEKPELFFDVLRAMLFYIDEFPEKRHHPKETELLFPRVAQAAPEVREVIAQLDRDHAHGEARVRQLMHLLMAWELLGDSRRQAFVSEVTQYVDFYLEHMALEESQILPAAERALSEEDWHVLNLAFDTNRDPINRSLPRDPQFDRLFTRIVMRAPSPVGLG